MKYKIIAGDVRYVENKLNELDVVLIVSYAMIDNMLVNCLVEVKDGDSRSEEINNKLSIFPSDK